ncbi:MAG TPA: ATP-binding protein [Bryobacteraceae bacterium]|nr:ATP-binding protein [Bryobacteraceae bacterium]
MAISLHDQTSLTGCGDGHLCGTLRTLCECHDLLAKLVVPSLGSQLGQSLLNVGRLYFTAVGSDGGLQWFATCREPERCGVELKLGYLNLKPEQSNIFFKLMEERYRQHSTIITTNLVYDEWLNFLGNRPMVEALLSRLRHYCHTVTIDGPSLREPQG